MALNLTVDSLEGMDASLHSHYVARDGKFVLDVQGIESLSKNVNADSIPKARFNEINEKRKAVETLLSGLVEEFMSEVPEEFQDVIPDLPPADKIKWLRNAKSKGLFKSATVADSPDSKRPAGRAPADFTNMNPRQIMAQGYKK